MADPDVLSEVLPEDRVPVVRPDGSLASVKKTNYEKALAKGYKFQSPEEQQKFAAELKYGDRPVAAGVAGALRGATLGASDVAGPALGLVKKETLAGLKEANPGASTVGDVVGTGASLLVPGVDEVSGPAVVSKIGRGVAEAAGLGAAKTLAEKAVPRILGGAVEGAAYGAGQGLSEEALGDPQLNAEKIISHIGLGSVLGAAGSGAGGLLGDTIEAGVGGVDKLLHTKAEDFAAKAIGGIQSSFKGLEKDEIRTIARDVIDEGIISPGANAKEILPKIKAAKEAYGQQIGDTLKAVDATGTTYDFQKTIFKLKDFEQGLNEAERDLIGSEINKKISQLKRAEARGGGFTHVNDLKTTMQGEINYKADPTAKVKLLRQAVGVLRGDIDEQLAKVTLPEEMAAFLRAKQKFGSMAEAEKWGKRGVRAMIGNRGASLTDYLSGVGLSHLGAGPAGVALGAAGALGNKLIRERGPALAARALEGLAGTDFAPAITPMLADIGAASASVIDSTRHLETLAKQLASNDDDIDSHVDAIFDGERTPHQPSEVHNAQDFGAKRMRRDSIEAHRKIADEAAQLAANPAHIAERVAKNTVQVGHVAPNITMALTQRAHAAAQYLAQEGAPPPKKGPLAPDHVPSQTQIHTYARKVEAVRQPLSVLKHAAAGTLTRDAVDALKAVHPTLARDFADRALMKMAENPKDVPYRAKLMLSLLTGIDVDGTMSPQAIAANQNAIAGAQGRPSEQTGKVKQTGAEKLSVASMTATAGQRREIKQTGEV